MRKEFVFVCAALFLLVFGANISGALLVPYAKTLGGTGITIGIVYSCMFAVRLLLGAPIGRISQKRGTKTMLTYSLLLYPFIALAYLISWNIPSLLAARLLHGVASAMMLPMAMAYMGEISPSGQEGRYMGVYNTIIFFASATGPFAGGLIYDSYGIRSAFLTLLVLAVCSLLIMLLSTGTNIRKATGNVAESDIVDTPDAFATRSLRHNNKLMALGSINIATSILLALLGASFTQLALSYNMSMGLIGLLIALNNIVIGLTQVPFGRFADRIDKMKIIIISGFLTSVFVILLPSVKSIWGIAAVVAVLGMFTALALTTTTALTAILGKEIGMGSTMGFIGSISSAGTIIGYLTLGWIADKFGISYSFYFTGVVFILGLMIFRMLWTGRKAADR